MGFRSRRKKKAANKKRKQRIGKTSIKDLPIDISLNILKRLPKTSLFSVRLVCKAFYQLVGHPTLSPHSQDLLKKPHWVIFRNLSSYIDKPYRNNQLYLVDNWRVVKRIIHPRIKKKFKPGPILSSNGLLCLLFYKDKHSCLDYYRACLFNPLTGKHDFLPDPGLPRVRESNHSGTIGCSNQFFGFGFDARTEEYKLINHLMSWWVVQFTGYAKMKIQLGLIPSLESSYLSICLKRNFKRSQNRIAKSLKFTKYRCWEDALP